jgi:hypothetical protein
MDAPQRSALHQQYVSQFTPEAYERFLHDIHPEFQPEIDFRIAETPVFVDQELKASVYRMFEDIRDHLVAPGFLQKMDASIPAHLKVPNEASKPTFVCIDLAVCQDEATGQLIPQLIEMQGVASLYCYQHRLCQAYKRHLPVPQHLTPYWDGVTEDNYLSILKKEIIGDEDPEQVVIMDIQPMRQKTRIDFMYTQQDLGIRAVCITDITQDGRYLYYVKDGKKIPIRKIYNRVIFDELERKQSMLDIRFNLFDDLNVTWMSHPNWFFKISKYTMPFIDSPYVPKTYFVHELVKYPDDLENYVLKPLYSFAGAGVKYDVTRDDVEAVAGREDYILQKKVQYVPFVDTPDIPAKVEIRLLCLWGNELRPLMNLARLSKGKIMGVDFNKDKTWVGSSAVFF